MKIVRVIARLNVGGPAKHVVWLTQGLQSPEWDSVLVAGTVPPGEEDMSYFAETMGISPVFMPEMSREISPKDFLTIWKLYRLFRRERPDIIHTHTAKAGTVGRLAGLLYRWLTPQTLMGRPRKCQFVHTYHGHIFHSYYGPLKTRVFLTIEKILARVATDRIIVISEQQQTEINKAFRVGSADRFSVIPLGLDLSLFQDWQARRHKLRAELSLSADNVLVGIVGRLTEVKNHKLFLDAIAAFKEGLAATPRKKVLFAVVGDGSLRQQLEQQAAALGLQDDVVFLGSRRDMENIYPAFDIAALTSLNEGTPLTLIEAMANARPVVSTLVGGVVDLLGPTVSKDAEGRYAVCERGLGVPAGNSEAFASAIQLLVSDEGLRSEMGEAGLQFVISRYSKDRLLDDVRQLYTDLHAGHKQTARAPAAEQSLESRS
jgi:glycosyltransferase involved in cell wall biosynthesis